MSFELIDIVIFLLFFAAVVGLSMFKSRREETSEDYFLAGRGLSWWLIGLSIVAANISTEQFVGMAGQGAGNVGFAVSGYQLFGAVTICFVALFFLPRFLKAGIYTMPEYLEYRYNSTARGLMALYTMVIYMTITITAVMFSGGLAMHAIFDMDLTKAIWLIGIIAAVYTTWGGLKAVVWADLFQGSGLIIGGVITMVIGFIAVGGIPEFFRANAGRLHLVLPSSHPSLPWTVLVLGLWIPNFYYCGLNQFIVQRTLAAKTLKQGQLGIIFAAAIWCIIPFIIVLPGIMAAQLYGDSIGRPDMAYPMLIRKLMPAGFRGFIFAALSGAVISSLASMLNSASTIFTMDLYKQYIKKDASQKHLVTVGRVMTIIFVLIGCLVSPQILKFGDGVFAYIQEFQGFISPAILAVFVFGFIFKKAPAAAGVAALVAGPVIYGLLMVFCGGLPFFEGKGFTLVKIAFLNRMALAFAAVIIIMAVVTLVKPLKQPVTLPVRNDIDMKTSPIVLWLAGAIITTVIAYYIIFW